MPPKTPAKRGRPRKPASKATQNVTLRLRKSQVEAIDKEAEEYGMTRTSVIQMAIARYLRSIKQS